MPTPAVFQAAASLRITEQGCSLVTSTHLILMALRNKRSIGRTPTDLVNMLGLDRAVITMTKNKLVAAGLIEERYPARDRRKVMLYLTAEGVTEAKKCWDTLCGLAKVSRSHFNTAEWG